MMSESAASATKSWTERQPGKEFSGSPSFYIFVDMDYFALLADVVWTAASRQRSPLTVPMGFVTDFASVPRLFWSLLPPIGRYGYAALFHDFVYWEQTTTRRDADLVFRTTMIELGVSKLVTFVLYESVRLFGSFAWRSNRKAKERGERRALKRFPSNLKITWKVWKQQPDVFK
jgi:Protein of unknown function (DUF1353)